MRLLGIDYGRRKIGLAIAGGSLAEPYKVIRVATIEGAVESLAKIAEVEQIEKVIVGISEGEMATETKKFVQLLKKRTSLPVELQDETLTTYEAQMLSISSGMTRDKRRKMEDAYSATLILQSYLDK